MTGRLRPLSLLGAFAAILALVLSLAVPAPAMAQESPQVAAFDNAAWERDATRAEAALETRRASNLALEQLRQLIVDWRTKFAATQTANQNRIETLRAQIAALGPVPAEGASEAPEIATRRQRLNDQLARLQAPGLAAVEAFSRADGIIREIDLTIRERQATALLKLSPSPANPGNWPAGLAVLTQGLKTLGVEVAGAWKDPERRKELRNNFPVILLYLLVAAFLMARGSGYFERLAGRLKLGGSENSRRLAAAFVSLGQVVLPVGGMYLLVQAVEATGMTGLRSGALIASFPIAALAFFAARWLGCLLFPIAEEGALNRRLSLLPGHGPEARFHASMLGLLLAVEVIRRSFITEVRPPLSQAAQSVWAAPVVLLIAVFLFRLGMLLRQAEPEDAAADEQRHRLRLRRLTGTAAVAAATAAPVLALVGYTTAANALVWPTVLSLALIGLLILAQRLGGDIYGTLSRKPVAESESLVPVLVGFVLSLAALPLFALIWGARTADLGEVWNRFLLGITLGETRISPVIFLTFAVIFVVGYTLTRLLQSALRATVLPKTRMDKGGQNAIVSGVGYLGIFLAVVVAVTSAGIDLSSLAIVAGALSLGIGFGLQNIVSNFVSGIILLIERPISEGDWIDVGGQTGIVRKISVRSTLIETFDRTDVIVPNADLITGVVTNWTRGNQTGRVIVPIKVAYGSDSTKVADILRAVAVAHPQVTLHPEPNIFFVAFGDNSLNFEIRAILRDVHRLDHVRSDLNHEIYRRFAEEGIEIPFPQRDVWLRNPDALRSPAQRLKHGRDRAQAAREPNAGPDEPPQADPDPEADEGSDAGPA